MEVDAYRLRQQWQAMHYPRRGAPDGPAGTVLERYFCRSPHARRLDAESGIRDLRVRELADAIIEAQRREIAETEWLTADIDENGLATSQEEAQGRPVPSFPARP